VLEIERPQPQETVFRTGHAKRFIDGHAVDSDSWSWETPTSHLFQFSLILITRTESHFVFLFGFGGKKTADVLYTNFSGVDLDDVARFAACIPAISLH
jgi:hypothetical protein